MASTRSKAWEVYCSYYDCVDESMAEMDFEEVSRSLDKYLRDIINGQVYGCSEFDMDDYLADAQLLLWQRLSTRVLPPHDQLMFLGAVKMVVRRMLIDNFRRQDAQQRAVDSYSEKVVPSYEVCHVTRLWATTVLKKHKTILARAMSKRSRFPVVTQKLALKVIDLFHEDAKLAEIVDVLEQTEFWDCFFLLAYLQVLYRWSCYDLRDQIKDVA